MELNDLIVYGAVLLGGVVVIFLTLKLFMSFRKTVPPSKVAVISGREYKYTIKEEDGSTSIGKRGFKTVRGGGFWVIPILEQVDYLDLNVMTFPVEVKDAPDEKGVPLTVKGVANVKIKSEDESLPLAIERFVGKTEEEIKGICRENLEGNLRSIVGTSNVEGLISDRQTFQTSVLGEAGTDMAKLGISVDILNIQDISDSKGYIDALGKKRTAEVVRDAAIGEAEARRDSAIAEAEAKQAGDIATAKSEEEISNAMRARDMVKAKNDAQVGAEQARIQIVAEIATAEEQEKLNIKQVKADQSKVEAQIELEEARKRQKEAQLEASTIVEAQKEAEALVIKAQGEEEAASRQGEAKRILEAKKGEGDQARDTAQAEGRKALASANQAELEAAAAGEKAMLLARAEGHEAMLLADAKGTEAKAEAFAKLDKSGRFLMILEALPEVVRAVGETIVSPAAKAIGEGLSNVDEIRLVDLGGGNSGDGKGNVLNQFMDSPIEAMAGMLHKANSAGMGPLVSNFFANMGIDDLGTIMAGAAASKIVEDAEVVPEDLVGTDASSKDGGSGDSKSKQAPALDSSAKEDQEVDDDDDSDLGDTPDDDQGSRNND